MIYMSVYPYDMETRLENIFCVCTIHKTRIVHDCKMILLHLRLKKFSYYKESDELVTTQAKVCNEVFADWILTQLFRRVLDTRQGKDVRMYGTLISLPFL